MDMMRDRGTWMLLGCCLVWVAACSTTPSSGVTTVTTDSGGGAAAGANDGGVNDAQVNADVASVADSVDDGATTETPDAGVGEYSLQCNPCQATSDCGAPGHEAGCVDRGKDGQYCGLRCGAGQQCPQGHACQDGTSSEMIAGKYCVPVDKSGAITDCRCSPAASQAKLSTPCWKQKKDAAGKVVGKCPGKRTCTGPVLTVCQMASPDAEVCDGIDNDCDGFVDPSNAKLCPTDEKCVTGKCVKDCKPVDGGWSAWQAGTCDKKCGTGKLVSTRTCTNPAPSCGGKACVGDGEKSQPCNTQNCPPTGKDLPIGKSVHAVGETVIKGAVPAGKSVVDLHVWGGGGGGGAPGSGGGGGYIHVNLAVKAGDALELRVGGGGVANGGGGGASYVLLNGKVQVVAGGGGGAGSDGCSGCSDPGFGAGGGGGAAGKSAPNGAGNDKYKTGSGGGLGGSQTAGGAGGKSQNKSTYTSCTLDGLPGKAHGGGPGAFGKCNHKQEGAKWQFAGKKKGGNGTGGDGGAGWFGGGSGASMYTYSGGGGGGGATWFGVASKLLMSEAGSGVLAGAAKLAPQYQGNAGEGGAGQTKASSNKAAAGKPGLIVMII